MSTYSVQERVKIIEFFYSSGRSIITTQRNYRRHFNVRTAPSDNMIRNLVSRFEDHGTVSDLPGRGRGRSVRNEAVVEAVRQSVNENPSVSTRRRSAQLGISRTSLPFISAKNRQLRLDFAKAHLPKGIDFWKKVLFTDESKYNIFGNDGRSKVWRKPNTALDPKNIIPTVKHGGGSVMVWGAMAASGVGRLVFVEGVMDRYQYKTILEQNLKPSGESLALGNQWIFQQDNDPKHTAHIVRDWLLYNAQRQLNTPPQSPDLNPIEHIWDVLEKSVRKYDISSRETLKTALTRAWSEIAPSVTENLVMSMPRRLQAVIEAQGGPTKY